MRRRQVDCCRSRTRPCWELLRRGILGSVESWEGGKVVMLVERCVVEVP